MIRTNAEQQKVTKNKHVDFQTSQETTLITGETRMQLILKKKSRPTIASIEGFSLV